MSLILHLSDLHLGSEAQSPFDYTDKFGLKPATGESKVVHLERTLLGLADSLREEQRTLDAIVVSGDLTNGNQQDGYDSFEEFLSLLGDRRPADHNVLVVPGNHDADWRYQPGDTRKFRRFLAATRSRYRSPLLYGVDYDDKNLQRSTGSRKKAVPWFELDDTSVVAISSADYCGVEERRTKTDWADVLNDYMAGDLDSDNDAVVAAALKKVRQAESDLQTLRVQDMARIHPKQFDALLDRLEGSSLADRSQDDPKLRIAVLHHPIGPVSGKEEVKAFESLTNLSTVRSFLFDKGFHVVLHGHKHESYLGWDWLLPPSDRIEDVPWRSLIIGSPGNFRPEQTVCRLLEVCPDGDQAVAGAPRLRVVEVPGVRAGETTTLDFGKLPKSLAQPFVSSDDSQSPWLVRAQSADAAYQQLRDLPAEPGVPRAVVSVVEDADSATQLPSNYPEPHDDEWLKNLVTWWQHPRPEAVRAFAGSQFNHGERLYGDNNAIAKAAAALPSSKAIALLVDATDAGTPGREYPALTAVQLQARASPPGTKIDVVGLFRKQDLALWWPVNMAELGHIQDIALSAAEGNSKLNGPVSAGRLVAIATLGVHDTVLPQMAGTVLDRSVDLDPDLAHRLAYLAAQPKAETQAEWQQALGDIGSMEDGVVLVPSIGITRLHQACRLQRDLGDPSGIDAPFVKRVRELEKHSLDAVEALTDDPNLSQTSRDLWSQTLQEDVRRVLARVKTGVQAADLDWA